MNIEYYILKQYHDILLVKISYANHHQFTSIGVRIPSSFIILPKALGGPSANPSYGVIKSSNHPGLALRLPCLSFSVENFLRNSVPSIKYQLCHTQYLCLITQNYYVIIIVKAIFITFNASTWLQIISTTNLNCNVHCGLITNV